jgi:MFS family permease
MVKIGVGTLLGTKTTLANVALITNALVWYYVVLVLFLQDTVARLPAGTSGFSIAIWGVHFSSVILSALVGAVLANRVDRGKLLMVWMLAGVASSLTLLLSGTTNVLLLSLIGAALGVSLGFGMPACISQFTDSIPLEARGRISGLTLFMSGVGIFAFSVASITDFWILGILLAVWRTVSILVSQFAHRFPQSEQKKSVPTYKKIVGQRSFILYFVPWVMFSLINYLVAPSRLTIEGGDQGNLTLIQTGFMGVAAIIGGFLLDSTGRKRIAVVGFTLLGLGTAVLGISTESTYILYFNAVVDGIAWGLLLVLFVLTIWGDLSQGQFSDKYYAIGVAPFFISKFLDLTVGNTILVSLGNSPALFSFGAFFLFIAVLPLVYAPETLPEKLMKDRDLRSYAEKALKQVQKETEKPPKKGKPKEENKQEKPEETPKESPEDEEARKLAEKYY